MSENSRTESEQFKILLQQTSFITSAAAFSQLPEDEGMEVAFAGRSNAGKSSVLNTITQQKHLAKTSNTPGRTQLINLFRLDDERRLVDLPGYGYAKVAKSVKRNWDKELATYLEKRQCLRGLVIVMDIRHPLKEFDQHMVQWAVAAKMPVRILLNKSDKFKKGAMLDMLRKVQKELAEHKEFVSVQTFSALKKTGIEELNDVVREWFGL